MNGLKALLASKKGVISMAAMILQTILAFVLDVDPEVICGAIAGTAGLHSIGQGLADKAS